MWLLSGAAASWLPRQDLFLKPCFNAWLLVFKIHVLDFVCELRDAQILQWYTQANEVLIRIMSRPLFLGHFFLSKDQDIPFPILRAHGLLLLPTPVWSLHCPSILSEMCIWPFPSLACGFQGLLANLRIRLRLYILFTDFSLCRFISSSGSRILSTRPEHLLHLGFGEFQSLCWDHVLPFHSLFAAPHSSE